MDAIGSITGNRFGSLAGSITISAALPGVSRVERLNGHQFVLGREPKFDPTDVLVGRSVDQGWGLYQLGPAHSRLEDVFVHLTRDEPQT